MIIGIDASRAFLSRRTGIEEYSYQVIKHLRAALPQEARVILYMRPGQGVDFTLPKNWKIKRLWAPRLWTQGRLSLEMLLHMPDTLFVPAHVVPLIHPKKTIVTIHGLEYEICPESYSFSDRWYMRLSILFSCRFAEKIIAVSENTQRDLLRLYHVPAEKVTVIYEGFNEEGNGRGKTGESQNKPFFLFVGRLEERKNIARVIEAFDVFKEKTGSSHQLILAGKPGYGYKKIKEQRTKSKYSEDILEPGYVSEEKKWELLKNAEAFLFPTLYEGFGIPVLEAQSVGTPVITSNTSSLPEVAGDGAILVDPLQPEAIALAMESLVANQEKRADIIVKGRSNTARFSWQTTAERIRGLL
ncbi:MAG: glycosyltransferase family 1 protein [Candidatus Moraniibacteriota bacterium]